MATPLKFETSERSDRDYDPETGRWVSKDPLLFGGGDTNLYGYSFSDPVNFIDPYGLSGSLLSAVPGINPSTGRPFYIPSSSNPDELPPISPNIPGDRCNGTPPSNSPPTPNSFPPDTVLPPSISPVPRIPGHISPNTGVIAHQIGS